MKIQKFILLILLFFSIELKAQQVNLEIITFEPLASIDFITLTVSEDLLGAVPRTYGLIITPENVDLYLVVDILWRKIDTEQFLKVIGFKTKVFSSRTIFNDELGSKIGIDDYSFNNSLVDQNREVGVPSGAYQIIIKAFDPNGKFLGQDSKIIEFFNPEQTLSIISPFDNSYLNKFSIILQWNRINGIKHYTVRANTRKYSDQNDEDAIRSGNPVINDRIVGLATEINAMDLFEREVQPGDEVLFQVTANIPAPGEDINLKSEIISVFVEESFKENVNIISENIKILTQTYPFNIDQNLISKLLAGNIGNIISARLDGKLLSNQELVELLNYLSENPSELININIKPKE